MNVQVKETSARGYYLSISSADLGVDLALPDVFIQPVKNGKRPQLCVSLIRIDLTTRLHYTHNRKLTGKLIHCTTEEVYSLNNRAQENVQDLLLMTHGRIQEVLQVARDNFDCLASLSDAIALLDMCHCFADNVASSRLPWTRPILTDSASDPSQDTEEVTRGGGSLAIRNGRYPIDTSSVGALAEGEYVPNDTFASSLQNFVVLTGINGR